MFGTLMNQCENAGMAGSRRMAGHPWSALEEDRTWPRIGKRRSNSYTIAAPRWGTYLIRLKLLCETGKGTPYPEGVDIGLGDAKALLAGIT
jgi:hypothetical protein